MGLGWSEGTETCTLGVMISLLSTEPWFLLPASFPGAIKSPTSHLNFETIQTSFPALYHVPAYPGTPDSWFPSFLARLSQNLLYELCPSPSSFSHEHPHTVIVRFLLPWQSTVTKGAKGTQGRNRGGGHGGMLLTGCLSTLSYTVWDYTSRGLCPQCAGLSHINR